MFVVPLRGDKVETKDGVIFTVLSFTNYRERGPAVYVEHTAGVPSDAVYFFDIIKINGKSVEYFGGPKLFKTAGQLTRKYQLPQLSDVITYKDKTGTHEMKVSGLKLHRRGALAKGMFIIGSTEDSDEKQEIRLSQIIDIERDIGNDMFSRDKFLSYYSDYKGS